MSSRQKKPDARALFKQAKSRKGDNGPTLKPPAAGGVGGSSKYHGKSKEEVGRIYRAYLRSYCLSPSVTDRMPWYYLD